MRTMEVVSREEVKDRAGGLEMYGDNDLARCIEIQEEGGLGQALVLFHLPLVYDRSQGIEGLRATYCVGRYELWREAGLERPERKMGDGELKDAVMAIVNGEDIESLSGQVKEIVISAKEEIENLSEAKVGSARQENFEERNPPDEGLD